MLKYIEDKYVKEFFEYALRSYYSLTKSVSSYFILHTEIEESTDPEFAALLAAYARRLYITHVNELTKCPLCVLHYSGLSKCILNNTSCVAKEFCIGDSFFKRKDLYDLVCDELKKRNLSYYWLPNINHYSIEWLPTYYDNDLHKHIHKYKLVDKKK